MNDQKSLMLRGQIIKYVDNEQDIQWILKNKF